MVKHQQILAIILTASVGIAATTNAAFAQGMQQGSQGPEAVDHDDHH
ncbi:hypothetical protein GPM19_07905 [Halomonas sp. ZH2S]|uniref:Uncharacterized protein n=1 Tax=Vreelandella zhuhanensis TaxID=2684210 RepID=A0A7X3H074_9GAMM|nr:hypothetical protein [Halomonas zhuhanensis]MWJ28128.1 hypothetical protein [Halomonas zhuhanensis]